MCSVGVLVFLPLKLNVSYLIETGEGKLIEMVGSEDDGRRGEEDRGTGVWKNGRQVDRGGGGGDGEEDQEVEITEEVQG